MGLARRHAFLFALVATTLLEGVASVRREEKDLIDELIQISDETSTYDAPEQTPTQQFAPRVHVASEARCAQESKGAHGEPACPRYHLRGQARHGEGARARRRLRCWGIWRRGAPDEVCPAQTDEGASAYPGTKPCAVDSRAIVESVWAHDSLASVQPLL